MRPLRAGQESRFRDDLGCPGPTTSKKTESVSARRNPAPGRVDARRWQGTTLRPFVLYRSMPNAHTASGGALMTTSRLDRNGGRMSLRTGAATISLQQIVTHSIDFRHRDEGSALKQCRPRSSFAKCKRPLFVASASTYRDFRRYSNTTSWVPPSFPPTARYTVRESFAGPFVGHTIKVDFAGSDFDERKRPRKSVVSNTVATHPKDCEKEAKQGKTGTTFAVKKQSSQHPRSRGPSCQLYPQSLQAAVKDCIWRASRRSP